MKKMIMFVVMLLSMSIVFGIAGGENFTITTVEKCVGTINVQIKSVNTMAPNELFLEPCGKENDYIWNCNCLNPTIVYFQANENASNTYDFIVSYSIETPMVVIDDSNASIPGAPSTTEIAIEDVKRKYEINNIQVEPKVVEEPFVFPEIKGLDIIMVLIVFIFVVGGIVVAGVFVYKMVWKKELIEESKIKDNISDKEVDNVLKRL